MPPAAPFHVLWGRDRETRIRGNDHQWQGYQGLTQKAFKAGYEEMIATKLVTVVFIDRTSLFSITGSDCRTIPGTRVVPEPYQRDE